MYDFFGIELIHKASNKVQITPVFYIKKNASNELMVRGGDFYAVWNEKTNLWSLDEDTIVDIVDKALLDYYDEHYEELSHFKVEIMYMNNSHSGTIDNWHKYVQRQLRENYHQLDTKVIFSNTETTAKDYATKRLPYSLEPGNIDSYEELMSTLYSPEQRDKLEWAVGSIISGDAKNLQKFIVLYGEPGSGKSTFLNIVQKLFDGYYCIFDAKELTAHNNSFALESFKNNPLVAIQHDGDLSRIEDNTKLNSIVSHEIIEVNEKFKSKYAMRFNSFLFMGTNKPVKITDSKAGILRRLIDVYPSGNKVPVRRYNQLMNQIDFELGAIAYHCLKKYEEMGFNYYDTYVPMDMMSATNDFYDFVDYYYDEFIEKDYVILKDAWSLYKSYCDFANVQYPMGMRSMRNEFGNYFDTFLPEYRDEEGKHFRNVYFGFKKSKFNKKFIPTKKSKLSSWINLSIMDFSIFDKACEDCPAQLASKEEKPTMKWAEVSTTLKEIDTRKLHYVKVPTNHIVIDFDLKDENGNKSFEKNLEEASKWPPTYAELSKSEAGIHLHYIYDGDVNSLSRIYSDDIEVKVFVGKSSLRRKLTKCNNLQISHINSGLPLKENKAMVDFTTIKNEKALRTIIKKNLNKEYHGATKPSVDFIYRVLDDAYNSGMRYDVSDMKQAILYFASNSTHQADYCLELVTKMKFKSKEDEYNIANSEDYESAPIVFYDVEIFPNLFLVNWKFLGTDNVNRMINPSPTEIAELIKYKLVGFNCRRYDNHVLYARMMGYNNMQLYHLSQRLIDKDSSVNRSAMFANAYNLSYTDIYDFMKTKQSLKKWEIELGIHHQELGLPWDKPVPEDQWNLVAEYCDNDVIATEALWKTEECQADFTARKILAELSGLSVNHTTNNHTAKIIFGDNKNPQDQFIYTDLSKEFPGYKFDYGEIDDPNNKGKKKRIKKSSYRDVDNVGEGGYVYANPGMYENVWTFDISSMHPHSIKALNLFGDMYTKIFWSLVEIRLDIKHKKYDKVRKMFDGKLEKYLKNESQANQLSGALKIAINAVYGQTFGTYANQFKDPRNVDNIVAKRGALFMIDLRHELEDRGIFVIHIKTDSIKISNPSKETEKFIMDFGKKYGYTFEVEDIYKKFCLVNDAVYIAQHEDGSWTSKGAQFAQPYVFKTLFSKEKLDFKDYCETKTVKTAMYLDLNEGLEGKHNYKFVGRVGSFCPVLPGKGGGELYAERGEDPETGEKKYYAVQNSKGYRWLEAEEVEEKYGTDIIDKSYFIKLADDAIKTINEYGDFEMFVN